MSSSRRFKMHIKSASSSKPSASSNKKKRRVLFVEERNTVREFEAVDNADEDLLESLWQQGYEMLECKQTIKVRAKKWRQTGMGMFLNDVYHCDNDLSPALCQKQLNAFAQLPDDMHMRGVERYLSRKHDQERTSRKRTILGQVVAQFNSLQAHTNLTQAESERLLAQFARRLNQDAELFARRIGKADELVVRQGEAKNIQPALELLDYLHKAELEKIHKGSNSSGRGQTTSQQSSQLKPPPVAAFTAGRRLQARQA